MRHIELKNKESNPLQFWSICSIRIGSIYHRKVTPSYRQRIAEEAERKRKEEEEKQRKLEEEERQRKQAEAERQRQLQIEQKRAEMVLEKKRLQEQLDAARHRRDQLEQELGFYLLFCYSNCIFITNVFGFNS